MGKLDSQAGKHLLEQLPEMCLSDLIAFENIDTQSESHLLECKKLGSIDLGNMTVNMGRMNYSMSLDCPQNKWMSDPGHEFNANN